MIESSSCSVDPPGKSVLPTEPANSTSPTKTFRSVGFKQNNVPGRVAGTMDHLEFEFSDLINLAVFPVAIHLRRRLRNRIPTPPTARAEYRSRPPVPEARHK